MILLRFCSGETFEHRFVLQSNWNLIISNPNVLFRGFLDFFGIKDLWFVASDEFRVIDHSNELKFDVSIVQNESGLIVKGTAKVDRTKFDIKYNSSSFFQDLGNYAIKNDLEGLTDFNNLSGLMYT